MGWLQLIKMDWLQRIPIVFRSLWTIILWIGEPVLSSHLRQNGGSRESCVKKIFSKVIFLDHGVKYSGC